MLLLLLFLLLLFLLHDRNTDHGILLQRSSIVEFVLNNNILQLFVESVRGKTRTVDMATVNGHWWEDGYLANKQQQLILTLTVSFCARPGVSCNACAYERAYRVGTVGVIVAVVFTLVALVNISEKEKSKHRISSYRNTLVEDLGRRNMLVGNHLPDQPSR